VLCVQSDNRALGLTGGSWYSCRPASIALLPWLLLLPLLLPLLLARLPVLLLLLLLPRPIRVGRWVHTCWWFGYICYFYHRPARLLGLWQLRNQLQEPRLSWAPTLRLAAEQHMQGRQQQRQDVCRCLLSHTRLLQQLQDVPKPCCHSLHLLLLQCRHSCCG
jgi:hypothetical protein